MLLLVIILILSLYAIVKVCNPFTHKGIELYSFGVQESCALKGILALGVVLSHLQIYCFKPHDYPIVNQFAILAQVGVFFFISGYGLVAGYTRKGDEYLHGFLRHRVTKIITPLLIATVAYLIEKNLLLVESGGG